MQIRFFISGMFVMVLLDHFGCSSQGYKEKGRHQIGNWFLEHKSALLYGKDVRRGGVKVM